MAMLKRKRKPSSDGSDNSPLGFGAKAYMAADEAVDKYVRNVDDEEKITLAEQKEVSKNMDAQYDKYHEIQGSPRELMDKKAVRHMLRRRKK